MTIIITKVEKNLGKIALLIVYALVIFWFLINGEGLFSAWETSWTFNGIIYVLGVALFLQAVDELPEELKSSAYENLKYFASASLLTLILLLIARDLGLMFQGTSQMPYHLIPANMTFQLIVVSSSEEIIFRGAIFGYLYDRFRLRSENRYGWIIPYFGSAFIFAIYHFTAYGADLLDTSMVFFMGLVFAYAVERWGLGASIGAHWIWNCVAIGIFCLPRMII